MIFTKYWGVLVLKFSEIENTVFFWAKKLMERLYLLNTKKVLFWTFQEWEIRSFFEPKSWWKDNIYWLLKRSCFELFGDGKYGLFFQRKSWWKDDIYLVFLSFPWYSRTWEIWFFVQCQKEFWIKKLIKRKGNKVYVKWKGCDDSFNRWIYKKDILQNEPVLS